MFHSNLDSMAKTSIVKMKLHPLEASVDLYDDYKSFVEKDKFIAEEIRLIAALVLDVNKRLIEAQMEGEK